VSQVAGELPYNPVMAEGYADKGSPAQRYLAAEQRAQAVKTNRRATRGKSPGMGYVSRWLSLVSDLRSHMHQLGFETVSPGAP